MRRWIIGISLVALGCPSAPHGKTEATVVYRASFRSEAGVSCRVQFPLPQGALADEVATGLSVSDGGLAKVEVGSDDVQVLSVEGRGSIEANYEGVVHSGLGEGGVPEVALTHQVPDGGVEQFYLNVNKGGSALLPVEFEFSAVRDCGSGCGGKKRWNFQGPVGLSVQEVTMSYSEEKTK